MAGESFNENNFSIQKKITSSTRISNILTVNISGQRFQLVRNILNTYANTRLGRLATQQFAEDNLFDYYDELLDEYFFQRDPTCFPMILAYYASGQFHLSCFFCVDYLQNEMLYWGIPFSLQGCCSNQRNIRILSIENKSTSDENPDKIIEQSKLFHNRDLRRDNIWNFLDNEESSTLAMKTLLETSYYITLIFLIGLVKNMTFYRGEFFCDENLVNENVSVKVLNWLSTSHDSGLDIEDPSDSLLKNDTVDAKLLNQNDSKEDLSHKLSKSIQNQINKIQGNLEIVPWDVTDCDTLVQVDKTLFPIQRQFVAYVSGFFSNIVDRMNEMHHNTIVLNGFEVEEIRTVLTFIYTANEEDVTDMNVASLLQLAKQFKVKRILRMCEKHLLRSLTFNRVIAIQLAQQYKLDYVFIDSCIKLSQVESFEDTAEFLSLNYSTQNIVMRYALKRFQKAHDVIRHLDVYLCSHHGSDTKNNDCCFRSATYKTEDNHTFLVRMEKPQERILNFIEKVYNEQL